LKTIPRPCINQYGPVPDTPTTPGPTPQPRGPTIIAAGLLLAALAVVVLYTSRRAFLSPVAMVVVAAIGVAALLLQRRLRPSPHSPAQSSNQQASSSGPLRLNAAGVVFAIAAVFADVLHLNPALMLIAALAAVISFAISAVVVLKALRTPRP
jgi:preprotein translocase subunit SecY